MKILVLNAGSSSLKYKLFVNKEVTAHGIIENIKDYHQGIVAVEERLKDICIEKLSDLDAVGHRVVHGGAIFKESVLIDQKIIETIKSLIPLAPLHNLANLEGILMVKHIAPQLKQVAVFDTAFHQTMPKKAYRYALPEELYRQNKIRKYGFHGTSHSFIAKEASKILGKPLEETNLITLHLGNGASVCAIQNGKSIDTSMGFTPLEGLIMGTRSGDIDPAIVLYLARELGYSNKEIDTLLNKKSGLLAICAENDMRIIHTMIEDGNQQAKLALDMFVYRIQKYIGAYYAILDSVDALIFSGGIGENDAITRDLIIDGLSFKLPTLVIKTDEELAIASEVERLCWSPKYLQSHLNMPKSLLLNSTLAYRQ
ncbi:Acetate kinase [hydrothermal vent metagenome]|uniref:Acetate kinase n=1 Tax=hydrothermal vent metagenome TaxID=652676 RepID=A0A1W1BRJ8_9ZZZZ